jgi:hypothetical protein
LPYFEEESRGARDSRRSSVSKNLSCYRLLMSFLRRHLLGEMQETERPDESADLLALAVRRLPADDFLLLSTLPPVITGYDGAHELEHGLDILLRGFDNVVARQRNCRCARSPSAEPE